jgi:hypothetical protein
MKDLLIILAVVVLFLRKVETANIKIMKVIITKVNHTAGL